MKKRYDKKAIMNRAHELRKAEGLTMGEAMKKAWSEAKADESPLDKKAQAYFDKKAAYDKAKRELEEAAGELQNACLESPDFCISGYGWNASFKPVTSQRFDTATFKAQYADMYRNFCKPSTARRFLCKPVALYA